MNESGMGRILYPTQAEDGFYKISALGALSEIAANLSTDMDIEKLLDRFLSTMIKLAGATAGAVRVLTEDGTRMRLVGSRGLPPDVVEKEKLISLDCGICGCAILESAIQKSDSVYRCRQNTASSYFGEHCRTIVAVPLRHKGKVMGVYNLFMADNAVIPQEVALLFNSISEHLGMALENVRLTRENHRITLMAERQTIASEIHDSLAQTLAYAKMRLDLLSESVKIGHAESVNQYLDDLEDAVASAYSQLRDLLTEFRHPVDARGLLAAVNDLIGRFCHKNGTTVKLVNRAAELDLSPDQEIQVFYIIQEALANICKHAKAQHVSLSIDTTRQFYVVTIADDGIGLEGSSGGAADAHFGINIMRERAERLAGKISIDSKPGEGTTVKLQFPVERSTTRHE
ncbi:MAG: GAF domain-containing sensor histidine kinase [Burkholderiales bacterium]